MSTIDDGGPAFPQQPVRGRDGTIYRASDWDSSGMTLRDYFAAKAMQGLMVRSWSDPVTGAVPENIFSIWAGSAYELADAMLAAREKKGE